MEKFLVLIREDLQKMMETPEEVLNQYILEMTKWVEELGVTGNFVSGEPLLPTGKYVSKNKIISDGPFIEAKEAISGFIIIKANNLNQAAEICQTCPHVLQELVVMEVRPIMEIG